MSRFNKVAHDDGWATQLWFIVAADDAGDDDEQPPATHIVCERMYDWAADWLLEILNQGHQFGHEPKVDKL